MNHCTEIPSGSRAATMARRLLAEALGSAMLLAVVVGSGIMAERLAAGNVAVALLANTVATGAGLFVLILLFAPLSGAHFNPVVTLASAWHGELAWRDVLPYLLAQVTGAVIGVMVAHVMFAMPLLSLSAHVRSGGSQVFSEAVATFGLLLTIRGCAYQCPTRVPGAVAAYIMAAYWFTASTSFANPAVTLARALSDSFAGIRPDDVPGFWLGQLAGLLAAGWGGSILVATGHASDTAGSVQQRNRDQGLGLAFPNSCHCSPANVFSSG